MQDHPICFQCDRPIRDNPDIVFESPCGHDKCSSAVFHTVCLFDWREKRLRMMKEMEHDAREMSQMIEELFKQFRNRNRGES